MLLVYSLLRPNNDLKDLELECKNGSKYNITRYKSLICKFELTFFPREGSWHCHKASS